MDRRNLNYEREVIDRLAFLFEGNMLAAANEIHKLSMGFSGTRITTAQIDQFVADQGQFNTFALADACLAGKSTRALRLLQALRNEGEQPILILWVFSREVRIICDCASMAASSGSMRKAMADLRIWRSKQIFVEKAVQRHGVSGCERILRRIARTDRILKGQVAPACGDIWNELERVALLICGVKQLGEY